MELPESPGKVRIGFQVEKSEICKPQRRRLEIFPHDHEERGCEGWK